MPASVKSRRALSEVKPSLSNGDDAIDGSGVAMLVSYKKVSLAYRVFLPESPTNRQSI
jgi:hypothetical protein